MRIKRFYENEEQSELSVERVGEITDELDDFLAILNDKDKYIDSLITELNNYKNVSDKGNDQIDDSIAALELVKKDLSNAFDKLDTTLQNLKSYTDEGRKYLYTETK
jgi:ABC-type transporter Mla subunit MlaD